MTTIVLYFDGTFINRDNGAHARVMDCIRFILAGRNQLIVYSYADHPSCPWQRADIERFKTQFPEAELVLDRRNRILRFAVFLKSRLIACIPSIAKYIVPLTIPGLTPHYDRLRRKYPHMIVISNYAFGLIELNGLDPDRVVVDTHDIQFVNSSKALRRSITSLKSTLTFRVEMESLRQAAALIAIAPGDAALFRMCFSPKPIFQIPAYMIAPLTAARESFHYDLLFVGSENVFNVDGLCEFLEAHRGWLSERKFAVVGRVCAVERVQQAVRDMVAVELLGYVDDLNTLMRRCKVLVSPVDGTGLKIKVLEALSAGMPVCGSASTLSGLAPGYHQCAFEISEAAMQNLFDDEQSRLNAEGAALEYARKLVVNDDLENLKQYLLAMSPRGMSDEGQGRNAFSLPS